jgi:hypothetical protein
MDLPAAWCQVCVCGRTFSVPQAYTCHTRSCQKTNKRLASALEKAKGVWRANKRRKIEEKAARETLAGPSHPNTDFGNLDPTESSTPMALEVRIRFLDAAFRYIVK